jgi:regulator of sigma E protease
VSLISILVAVLGIGFLMIVHEGGHYIAARLSGMRVERFSIGIGPTIFKWKHAKSGTTFQLAAIPFLAYVQIAGMNPFEEIDRDDPSLYPNKGVIARIATIAAGPFANYLAAVLMIFGLVTIAGPSGVKVDEAMPGSPAEGVVAPGDVFLAVEDHRVEHFGDVIEMTKDRAGVPTRYTMQRGDETVTLTITPREEDGRGLIGVQLAPARMPRLGVAEAAALSIRRPWELTVAQVTGLLETAQKADTSNLVGPVGIGKMMTSAFDHGADYFIELLAFVSVALGLMNLLPLPALDGGRLMFLSYELVTQRRANERIETAVHYVGILVLLGLMVLVFYRDLINL